MNRYEPEGKDILVRYDGTETRVCVERYEEGNGISVDEMREFLDVLHKALIARLAFEQGNPSRNPSCWNCTEEVEPAPDADCHTDGEIRTCHSCGDGMVVVVNDNGSIDTKSLSGREEP